MREFIVENLMNTEGLDLQYILLNNAVALVVAFFLMFVYKITYSGAAYSRKFNVSLGGIVIITTSIMCTISNNVALSLGMVGALSIIRFRTAVKDVRDAMFIFWAIAMGIGCGVSQYLLVAMGAVTLFIFLLLTQQVVPDNRHLLVVRGELNMQITIEGVVENYFQEAAHQVVKSAAGDSFELIYGISAKSLKLAKEKNQVDIIQKLMHTKGVESANLVEQTDDIGR